MSRDEIQTGNPGGVSNQPAQRPDEVRAANRNSGLPIPDLRMPLPRRNVPAVLSCVSGLLALVYAVCSYSAVTYSPRWLASILEPVPIDFGIAALLVGAALILGIVGIIRRFRYPTAGGLIWAFSGIILVGLALWMNWITLTLPENHWWP